MECREVKWVIAVEDLGIGIAASTGRIIVSLCAEVDHAVSIRERIVGNKEPLAEATEGVFTHVGFSDVVSKITEISQPVAFPFIVIEC